MCWQYTKKQRSPSGQYVKAGRFYYFSAMDVQQEMQQLREEVKAIEANLREQYGRLQQVQARLHLLDPKGGVAPAKNRGSSFRLENFIGLKLIHLVGIVVLVIGVSIGVKYAFDRNLISEVSRILLAYAMGAALLLLSIRLKKNYALFSSILFSGAMATIYFTSYAGHVYYGLFSFPLVFGLMVLLTVFTAFQAIRYNRPEIALLGLVGAYAIPFLVSRNAENAGQLFLYIGIINLGVLYLRIRQNWQQVGWVAMLLTWALYLGWVETRFQAGQFRMGLGFLVFFFLLFIPLLLGGRFRVVAPSRQTVHFLLVHTLAGWLGALILFSPSHREDQVAHVTTAFAFIAALQGALARTLVPLSEYLRQVFYFLAVGFLIIATALYFDGLSVTFCWLLMAVGLFGLGIGQRQKTWRLAALALMALTLLKLLVLDSQRFNAGQKVAAYITLGLLLLVVSFLYQKFRQRWFDE